MMEYGYVCVFVCLLLLVGYCMYVILLLVCFSLFVFALNA